MRLALVLLSFFALSACEGDGGAKKEAAGTPADPVAVCKRAADVCTYQGAKLGVCTAAEKTAKGAVCGPDGQCLLCAPQH